MDELHLLSRTQTCERLGFHIKGGQLLFFTGVSELSPRPMIRPPPLFASEPCEVWVHGQFSWLGYCAMRSNLILDKPLSFEAKVHTPSLGQSS